MKDVRVIFSPEAKEVYEYLNRESPNSKTERTILKSVTQKIGFIKTNPHYGNPVSKNKIPKEYKSKYGNINLFRVELPNFWRMLYTLTEGETKIEIIAFVLDIIDHKTYDKMFGYKK
ncbi:hypothetical protein LCGC14_2094170 [marine sediment metagenome]|uniref:Plasmid stabilization system protein n=1 Tax=marine sediment metagenome TaxID=412755 RepID=A0A0F9EC23_9ZZZZ